MLCQIGSQKGFEIHPVETVSAKTWQDPGGDDEFVGATVAFRPAVTAITVLVPTGPIR